MAIVNNPGGAVVGITYRKSVCGWDNYQQIYCPYGEDSEVVAKDWLHANFGSVAHLTGAIVDECVVLAETARTLKLVFCFDDQTPGHPVKPEFEISAKSFRIVSVFPRGICYKVWGGRRLCDFIGNVFPDYHLHFPIKSGDLELYTTVDLNGIDQKDHKAVEKCAKEVAMKCLDDYQHKFSDRLREVRSALI